MLADGLDLPEDVSTGSASMGSPGTLSGGAGRAL